MLGTGEVIVDVVATRVLAYAADVFSGSRHYLLELPIVPGPGGIGRVRAVGPGRDAAEPSATGCSAIRRCARATTTLAPDIILQGLTAGSDAAPAACTGTTTTAPLPSR